MLLLLPIDQRNVALPIALLLRRAGLMMPFLALFVLQLLQ
jgi:hypothetical protein